MTTKKLLIFFLLFVLVLPLSYLIVALALSQFDPKLWSLSSKLILIATIAFFNYLIIGISNYLGILKNKNND